METNNQINYAESSGINYQNRYPDDDLNLEDEIYEINPDKVIVSDFEHPGKKRYSDISLSKMPVVIIIILANFIAGIMCIIANNNHFDTGGLNYEYIHNNKEYIRILSYMFLHANVTHFVNNMIALFIFGSSLEPRIGSLKTAIIYFVSGIASGLTSVYVSHMLHPDVIRFAAGASGAIFGVMCAAFFISFSDKTDSKKTNVIISIAFIIIYAIISNGANVDILGHLGGGICGGILVFALTCNKADDIMDNTATTVIAVVLTIIICFVGIRSAGIGTKASQMQDWRIDTVKNERIFEDQSVTFGECLDNKCSDPEWTIFTTSDNVKVVEFTGNVTYNNINSSLIIQFSYADNPDEWTINYMALNGTTMDTNSASLLFNYLCQDYFE